MQSSVQNYSLCTLITFQQQVLPVLISTVADVQMVEDLSDLTPKQVVERLDRNIVGQTDAKKAVRQLPPFLCRIPSFTIYTDITNNEYLTCSTMRCTVCVASSEL